jgi:hypothetical protein
MSIEKPAVLAESIAATQKAAFSATIALWSDLMRAAATFLYAAPVPALAPVRRRVRANARRLTGL